MPEINEKTIEFLKNVTYQLLEKMGVKGVIFTRIAEIQKNSLNYNSSLPDQKEIVVFNIKTDEANILIGHNGENLQALQHLIRVLTKRTNEELISFILDVNNYKKEKEEKLSNLARLAATKARETGKRIVLRPMSSYERRIIHLFLASESDLKTESEGVEPDRRITINCA